MVFPSVITEFFNGSAWVDISSYVVSDISGNGGFYSSDPSEFTASLGSSTFDLNNEGGLFTVYGGDSVRGFNTLAGWNRGTKIRHRLIYEGYDKEYWFGFVSDVVSDDGTWGDQRVHVTCSDWIDISARYPMKRSEILTDKTLADGVQSIVNRISVPPEGVDADPSTTTFDAIFDNVRSKTKALGEIDKLARSELGPVYILKDGVLKVEGSSSRKGTTPLTKVPVVGNNALLVSEGNALLVSDGNALLVSQLEDANLSLTSEKLDLQMKDEFWNDAYIKSYPTKTDTSFQVLFQIGTPIAVAAGKTVSFVANYVDPNGGLPVNGTLMQDPVATTDYLFNSASDGSGTNLTASGTVLADYYGDVVVYQVTNSTSGFLTRLQARGYGIYRTSSIESHVSITGSASAYGEKTFDLNQTYQTSPYIGEIYGASVLELYKTPKTRITAARYCANINSSQMLACMYLDIGSLIKVYDSRSGMNKWYHVTFRKFVILLGGVILITFGLREHPSIASGGLSAVGVDFSGTTSGDAVDFGYLPQVAGDGVTKYSMATWIYLRSVNANFSSIMNIYTSSGGSTYFYLQGNGSGNRILAFQSFRFDGGAGTWSAPTNALATGTWAHIVATYDINVSADPVIYIDAVSQTLTETETPSGNLRSVVGASFVIGNNGFYGRGVDAVLKGARFYANKILTQAEVTQLYNAGRNDYSTLTDGLVFQAFAINSDLGDAASLDGQQIPAENKFFDNVLRMVGEPHGSPLISNQ